MPAVWTWAWNNLPFLQPSQRGDPVSLGDTARTFKANIEQLFAGYPSRDGAPLAAADVSGIDLQALFLGMKVYFDRYGSVFKMCFGPKSFLVTSALVSHPVHICHTLCTCVTPCTWSSDP
ncbi:hypothetical protein T492DRAFT_625694 [Pavlovales sp. CCMP2436]|nr:hypothetical protein T492DRAFT_625694 [Pavlovales sp. CCMP2436]